MPSLPVAGRRPGRLSGNPGGGPTLHELPLARRPGLADPSFRTGREADDPKESQEVPQGNSRGRRTARSRCLKFRSEEHTSELQSRLHLVCRLLLEKKKTKNTQTKIRMADVAIHCAAQTLIDDRHISPLLAVTDQSRTVELLSTGSVS